VNGYSDRVYSDVELAKFEVAARVATSLYLIAYVCFVIAATVLWAAGRLPTPISTTVWFVFFLIVVIFGHDEVGEDLIENPVVGTVAFVLSSIGGFSIIALTWITSLSTGQSYVIYLVAVAPIIWQEQRKINLRKRRVQTTSTQIAVNKR